MRQSLQYGLITLLVLFIAGCAEKEAIEIKLSAPGSLKVSADNVLTWSIVKGAVGYIPNINGNDYTRLESNQLDLNEVTTGGHLVIKVKAVGDSTKNQDSDWSAVLEYDMAIALESPMPVVSGKTVAWQVVEGASAYEYEINGSIVLTESTTVDLSEYPADIYIIRVRALPTDNKSNSISLWSMDVTVAIFDRLATPQLTVNEPSLKNPSVASIVWDAVIGASGYDVLVDGIKREVEGTALDFTGQNGTFNVKVTAVNPGLYDASETAETVITVRDYGSGTEDNPYMIYTVQDWNDFSEAVNTNEALSGYSGRYLELASDIDFDGTYVRPAGVSSLMSFKGTLDGQNFTLKNVNIGDGKSSHQAFFYNLSGTVKNLKFDNVNVLSADSSVGGDSETSAGVIVAGSGNSTYLIENCHVYNSSVTSGNPQDKYGGYAGGLVGRAIKGMTLRNCSIINTVVCAKTQSAGGIVGVFSNGTIDSVLSSGNKIMSATNSGGVVGSMGPNAEVINCVSENNICEVSSVSAGGVVGANAWLSSSTGNLPQLVNVLSKGNTVKCTNSQSIQYLGLIVGSRGANDAKMSLKNCLVLSGKAVYSYVGTTDYPHAACVGIMIGYGSPEIDNCYFNELCRSTYDTYLYEKTTRTDGKDGGWCRNAVGIKQSTVNSDSKGGTTLTNIAACSEESLIDGSCLQSLNSWVSDSKSMYSTLKTWTADENGYPKL